MVFGAYYLTLPADEERPTRRSSVTSTRSRTPWPTRPLAFARRSDPALPRVPRSTPRLEAAGIEVQWRGPLAGDDPGRVFFNEALPFSFRYVNEFIGKNATPIGTIVEEISGAQPPGGRGVARRHQVAGLPLRDPCRVSRSPSTTSSRPRRRPRSSNKYEEQAAKVETNYRRGVIVDDERRQQEIEIWTNANKEVGDATDRAMNANFDNPIRMMVDSVLVVTASRSARSPR